MHESACYIRENDRKCAKDSEKYIQLQKNKV